MKNNKITNSFIKKVAGPDNFENAKDILKKLESGSKTSKEICKEINKSRKKDLVDINEETTEKLLNKLSEASIVNTSDDAWEFDEETFNQKLDEFSNLNEIINNQIANDFLEQKVDENDLEYVKYIILTLIDGVETDEEMHEKTDIKLNTIRKLLYKLHDASIANYKRNKDPETQWFTYTWRFEKEEYVTEVTKFYTARLNEREKLLSELENNLYFICCMEPEHFKGDYTESSEYEFYCPVCDYELEPYNAEEEKKLLEKSIRSDKRNFKKFEKAISE